MRERYADELGRGEPLRMAVRRVRLRSVVRVGFSVGWIISLLPALIVSAITAWALQGIWSTLDGWTPWTPWPANTRIATFTLPTPEFRPREALRVEGLYQLLAPIGHHPLLGAAAGTVVLTIIGGVLFAVIAILAGGAYNLFARATGGLEFELVRRERRPEVAAPTGRTRREEEWALEDETPLRW